MGVKGDKMTNNSSLSAELLVEKLQPINGVTSKKMFGGFGVFHEGKMFGMVDSKGNCFLKADDSNRSDFEAKGSQKHGKMPYSSIPQEILEDTNTLISWARKSIAISK